MDIIFQSETTNESRERAARIGVELGMKIYLMSMLQMMLIRQNLTKTFLKSYHIEQGVEILQRG